MSAWNGSNARFDRVRDPHYDQVPIGSLARDTELALSADPLPPPPLPSHPPVGSEFYPSDTEDGHDDAMDIKPVHRFLPDSVKNFFRGSKRWSSRSDSPEKNTTSGGVPCSPPNSCPPSPGLPGSYLDPYGGSGGSYTSQKEREAMLLGEPVESVSGVSGRSAMTYSERVEDYHQRYAYMKSWAGLLRILACVELLLGAAVFACVCAYVHKDNEWFNMFGYSQPGMGIGGMGGGAMGGMYGGGSQYTGPKTPFVLVVAGLAWVVTVIMLVLGMTMYYRTILLDSSWWPLTECIINFALSMLYMAGGIVYVRDTTRGGLCNYHVFNNGPNAAFCRTEAGQTAAVIFLFVNMVVYLVGSAVCVKLWRHEAARMRREALAHEMKTTASVPFGLTGPGSSVSEPVRQAMLSVQPDGRSLSPAPTIEPEIIRGHIPAGHIPKPVIIPDYVAKYPPIYSDEERDNYKAVFNDQYAEYKELHAEVEVLIKKFDEMDNMMQNIRPTSQMEKERVDAVIQEYQRKKMDPTFLEKKERCEYLKSKLAHIKQKIYEYEH